MPKAAEYYVVFTHLPNGDVVYDSDFDELGLALQRAAELRITRDPRAFVQVFEKSPKK